jgi:hypothetical protein
MAIDVYHKVLHKLYEVTDGKDSKAVNFKDLVKQLGFHGNYADIFERLSRESWIVETAKPDFVRITHWGAAEVKKSSSSETTDSNAELKRETNRAAAATKELTLLLEDFARSSNKDDFSSVEKKFAELQNLINQIKKNLA